MKEEETTPRQREREDGLSREEDVYTVPFGRKPRLQQWKKVGVPEFLTKREGEVAELICEGLSEISSYHPHEQVFQFVTLFLENVIHASSRYNLSLIHYQYMCA